MKSPISLSATATDAANAQALPSTSTTVTYHRAEVDGLNIFYREAGPKDAPTIVLLHGYPSSSRMFDSLLPLLAPRYHLIAPDYPGLARATLRHSHTMSTPLIIWPRPPTPCWNS